MEFFYNGGIQMSHRGCSVMQSVLHYSVSQKMATSGTTAVITQILQVELVQYCVHCGFCYGTRAALTRQEEKASCFTMPYK
jgi:hypothetical protein